MQSQQQLRWRGPPVPRAKPVPPEKWLEHEKELRELYEKMKLDDLMVMMKVRHNFTPSRRQYISQFEKWHLRKYQSPHGSQAVPAPSTSSADAVRSEHEAMQASHTSNAKRQHSLQSSRSSQASRGSSRPPVPPKKRQLLSEFMLSRDPYADLGAAFDNLETPQFEVGSPTAATVTASSSTETPLGGATRSASHNNAVSSLIGDDCRRLSMDEPSEGEMRLPCPTESDASEWEEYDDSLWSTPEVSSDQIARQERRIDSSRPIESFSQHELQDMKIAADCLLTLTFDKESFALNVLLFKHIKHYSGFPTGVVCSALIACARSCEEPSQIEIAQNLLRQALDESKGPINEAEKFVFRMLLADTYTRGRHYEDAIAHVTHAWRSVFSHENILQCLPKEHRALDLILYHHLSRSLHYHELLANEDAPSNDVLLQANPALLESQIQDHFLQKKPGPFELENGRLNNPCIRSCIRWCTREIEGTASEPRPWKTLIKKCEQHRWAQGTGLQRLLTPGMTQRQLFPLLVMALRLYLWQQWQTLRSDPAQQDDLLWAHQAENLMGISASELLGTIAYLIIHESDYAKSKLRRRLLAQARIGASRLSNLSDQKIGVNFLDTFSETAHLGPDMFDVTENISNFTILSWKGVFDLWNADWNAVREVARLYAMEFVEETLFMSLPEVHQSAPLPTNESNTIPQIMCAALLPTLASSLKSSQLSSLRILRDRIQQNVQRAMQEAATTLPSDIFRDPRRSSTSLPSMDELSQAISSTLSLLPLQRASNSALDVLANMSENAMYRLNDIRRNGSIHMQRLLDDEDDEIS
ncbi:hypothetical protein L207DRAFT_572712 [Hyaloscypha variabilis F]|uniref:Clr5 domain-containing protein n=1 Tax=Hyaloscypha variabilis (strain UAMH 11265 / GT02V1 / F) TaxID=1149755 RepID=A0A2J6QYZ0_HYAVF|nr:hypothetical protein L207DRAFT_572712 [Hyaloscypha variabilis F]